MNRRKFLKFIGIATSGLVLADKVIASQASPKYQIGVDVADGKDSTIIFESTKLGNDWWYREYHRSKNDFSYWLTNYSKFFPIK